MRPESALRPAQERTVAELMTSTGVQAVLGMGAGKTAAALTAIRRLLDAGTIRAAIVLAPRRVALDTWPREVGLWEHLARTDLVVLSGPPKRRSRLLAEVHEVYVLGIDNVEWLLHELKPRPADDPRWDVLVIDELSRFKSPRGGRAKALLKVARRFRAIWGLTGTPKPNSEEDQWMPLQLVSAGTALPPFDVWRRQNFMPLDPNGYSWKMHAFAKPVLAKLVDDWSFTIPPEDVTDVPFNAGDDFDTFVDLSAEARRDLGTLEADLAVELGVGNVDLRDPSEDTLMVLSKAIATAKMTQVLQGFLYRNGQTLQTYENPKLDALADLLDANGGEPVLIPYHFQEDLVSLRHLLGAGVPCLGAGMSDREAARIIEAWNAGEVPALPIHPASAGHGLNLQFGGRRLIWYHPTWSAELYAQTVKRLARPGQKLPVYSHRIRARHWLEDVRVRRVEAKIAMQADFINNMRVL